MKKIICFLIIIIITISIIPPVISYADSPASSTNFYTAYLDIEQVQKVRKTGSIDEETARYLSKPENPIDVKAAIINAISWDNGRDNADKYSNFIYKKPLNDLDLDNVPAHDLFCIGYFMAMDNYWEVESAVLVLEKASEAIPDSFTVAMVTAVAKAQVTFGNGEWYKVWGFVDDVIINKGLIKDMRSEAVKIIVNYMILYKDYTNTEESEDVVPDLINEDSEDVIPDLINEDSEDVIPDLINDGYKNLTCYSSDLLRGEFFVKSISQLKAYEELEKSTNLRISFVHIPEETLLYKLRVMSLSGDNDDAPDLIEFPWRRHSDLLENLAELDVIIELDELINETAPNLNAILQSNREIKKQVSSDDGHIYQIPKINLADNRVAVGTIIRGDILKRIGVGIPKTIMDWEIMLKAMKDSDKSIIPLTLTMGSLENSNSFIGAFGIPFGFGVKDGKVFYEPVEDSYKEFLITFNRWYTNGLIDPDFFLLSKSQLNNRVNSGNVGSFIGSVDNFKVSTDALLSIDSSSELIPAPYPVLQNTDALNVLSSAPVVSEYGITICSPNKYPTETLNSFS